MMNPILAPIVLWLYGLMIVAAPPNRPQFEPAAMESVAQAQERYQGIAQTVAKVAFDPAETPIPGTSRSYTASVLLSIAYHESSFRRDVDLGIGRMRLAKSGWNDHGRSWCLMQVNLGTKQIPDERPGQQGNWREESASQTSEGWWGSELLADREKCFRAGLHILQRTWGCRGGIQADSLAKYAGGECFIKADQDKVEQAIQDGVNREANERLLGKIKATRYASKMRVERANKWSKARPKEWKDQEVVQLLLEAAQTPTPAAQSPASLLPAPVAENP